MLVPILSIKMMGSSKSDVDRLAKVLRKMLLYQYYAPPITVNKMA